MQAFLIMINFAHGIDEQFYATAEGLIEIEQRMSKKEPFYITFPDGARCHMNPEFYCTMNTRPIVLDKVYKPKTVASLADNPFTRYVD